MGFFTTILSNRQFPKHDGRPLWNYNLSDFEFTQLQQELTCVQFYYLDPRDVASYFAEWWKRSYCGGSPRIQDVFNSLGRLETDEFNAQSFYEAARNGAQMIGVEWIKKQNTLYFRTMLLQGGIPIKHISENKSYYQNFLLGLLDLRPTTVEDIVLQYELTKLLPVSSRNETIYENCLAIISSILNDEDTYTSLFESHDTLKEIQNALIIRKHQLSTGARIVRPKIFWVMTLEDTEAKIHLRMNFSTFYTASSLSEILHLSEPASERTYHLYLDERLICSFRKTLSGDYKREWENQKFFRWKSDQLSPQFYCVCSNDRWEVNDLISIQPTIVAPTLWIALSDKEWRLVKGNAIKSANALLLLPRDWKHSSEASDTLIIDGNSLIAVKIEDQISVNKGDLVYNFYSNVDSFEWNIRTEKPSWMRKAEVVVVARTLKLYVYDHEGKIQNKNNYKVYFKSAGFMGLWQLSDGQNPLPLGLIDLKIECKGVVAYDTAYNIGNLKLEIIQQKFNSATLKWSNPNSFTISVDETQKISASSDNDCLNLQLNTSQPSIPTAVTFRLKLKNQKTLYFDIKTPFSGIGLIDKDGTKLNKDTVLSLNNLHGIRILTTHTGETIIRFWNILREEVRISKNVPFSYEPLITFKDEIIRLFYLADAMRHDNLVMVEIKNGSSREIYSVKGFTHQIDDISTQLDRKVKISETSQPLQLFAIPLNCIPEDISLSSMQIDDDSYHHLPESVGDGQFIIISDNSEGRQMQPRFINTMLTFEGISSSERVKNYHDLLLESDLSAAPWREMQAYYNICLQQELPFSTFDQIRAISRCKKLAAKAFFFLGIGQKNTDEFIQRQVNALEQDLGFCFHWIGREEWGSAIEDGVKWIGVDYHLRIVELMNIYFQESNLKELARYVACGEMEKAIRVSNPIIMEARSRLGSRVLNELPFHAPHTTKKYNIPFDKNEMVKLLLCAPIAVAESIMNTAERSIWAESESADKLRRNIQYAQFVVPDLYSKVLYHCLS
ncbi:MAG: hypothetical protein WKF68_03755 [Daejeonella sp.]